MSCMNELDKPEAPARDSVLVPTVFLGTPDPQAPLRSRPALARRSLGIARYQAEHGNEYSEPGNEYSNPLAPESAERPFSQNPSPFAGIPSCAGRSDAP